MRTVHYWNKALGKNGHKRLSPSWHKTSVTSGSRMAELGKPTVCTEQGVCFLYSWNLSWSRSSCHTGIQRFCGKDVAVRGSGRGLERSREWWRRINKHFFLLNRTSRVEDHLLRTKMLVIIGRQGHINLVGGNWELGFPFQEISSSPQVSSLRWGALPFHSICSWLQGLLGVQREGEGRANGERKGEGLVLAGQCLAECYALGGQRRVHSSSHFLMLSELRKCESKAKGHVSSLAASRSFHIPSYYINAILILMQNNSTDQPADRMIDFKLYWGNVWYCMYFSTSEKCQIEGNRRKTVVKWKFVNFNLCNLQLPPAVLLLVGRFFCHWSLVWTAEIFRRTDFSDLSVPRKLLESNGHCWTSLCHRHIGSAVITITQSFYQGVQGGQVSG